MFLKRHFNKESFKSYMLALLIISSLVQVGILWNFQSHGFPISVFSKFFPSPKFDYKQALGEYFVPYRTIISSGDRDYKVLPNEALREKLWKDAVNYLKLTATQKPKQVTKLSEFDWGELAQKRVIMHEFKAPLFGDAMNTFLGIKITSGENLEAIYKVIVYPAGSIQSNNLSVYINTGTNVYKYDLTFIRDGLTLQEYTDVFNIFEQKDLENENELKLGLIKDFDPSAKSFSKFKSDILCVMIPPKDKSFYQLEASFPKGLDNSQNVKDIILDDQKDNFEDTPGKNGIMVFKNLDSMYKVYPDGMIIYKNLSDNAKVLRGEMDPALNKALEFVSRAKRLLDNRAEIYISSISKNNNYYEFTFDYRVDSIPVYLNIKEAESDGIPLKHAFVIKVNSKGLLDCRSFLRNFKFGKEKKSFDLMLSNIFDYNELSYTGFSQIVKDMEVGYFIRSDKDNSMMMWPSWSFLLEDGAIEEVGMPEGKGE